MTTDQSKIIRFDHLEIRITVEPDCARYHLKGDVDESFRFADVPIVTDRPLIINLEEVVHFNSIGIREWVHLIESMTNQSQEIQFEDCSVGFVDQINMVPETKGRGQVISFYAPYYCECGEEVNRLIVVEEHRQQLMAGEAPQFDCECGKALEFDAIEDCYFQFIQSLSKVG